MIEPTDEMVRAYETAAAEEFAWLKVNASQQGLAAILAIVERDYDVRLRQVVHRAVKGDSHVHCCGIELLDLPRGHRWTTDPHGATCRGAS